MIRKLFSSQLRINMTSGVMTTVISIVALMAAYPIYLHFLGYEKYGVWLVLATVLSFAQLGNFGIGPAVTKLVAEEYGRGNIEGIQRYVTIALALLCLSGAATLAAILVLKNQIITVFNLTGENAGMVSWLLPYIGCLSLYVFIVEVLNATLSGLGRMDLANYIRSAGQIVTVATAGILLYFGHGIESLLIGNTLSCVFVHIVSLILIWRIAHIRLLRISNFNAQCCKRLLRIGGGVFGSSIIIILFHPFNKLMLSRYAGVSSIPVYEIAFKASVYIRNLVEAGIKALMPEISRLSGLATVVAVERIRTMNRKLIKLILCFGSPFYILLFLTAELLLRIWLRDNFNSTLPLAFRLFLIGTFFNLLAVPAYYTLLGLGKVKYLMASAIIISGGNIVLVLGRFILNGQVSVTGIFTGLILLFTVSTFYLIVRVYREITYLQAAVATNN